MKGYKQYLQYLAMTIATVFAVNGFVVGEVIIYILIGIFTITTLFCLAVSIGYNALVKKDIKHHTEKSKTAVDDLLKTCTIPRLIIGHVFSSIVPIILIYNGWLWTPIIYIIGYILLDFSTFFNKLTSDYVKEVNEKNELNDLLSQKTGLNLHDIDETEFKIN